MLQVIPMEVAPLVHYPLPAGGMAVEAYRRLRADISQVLHDTVCQSLNGASLLAHALAGQLAAGESISAAEMDRLKGMLDHARREAQALGQRFQEPARRPDALMGALALLAESAKKRIECEFRCDEAVLIRNVESAHALYIVAQEAVDNALRHAGATRLTITLTESDGWITLEVTDDGRGLAAAASTDEGRGVQMMRWHAAKAEGSVAIESELGRGTTVRCAVKA